MRSAQRIVATLAVLLATASEADAQSGALPDVRGIKPVVMLLVDTSGSMERMPDTSSGDGFPQCSPTNSERNRWAVTLESLTGKFEGFRCIEEERTGPNYPRTEYDHGYYLPHFRPEFASQGTDGLLDTYGSRLKFGLMTFDGVGTTLGGDTLVPLVRWAQGTTFREQADGAPGMYSYGRVGRLSFPGCETDYGINAGARGPAMGPDGPLPGALIAPPLEDYVAAVEAVNQKIQTSLLQVRPFGGTPIAAMLDDLQYFLVHDKSVRQGTPPEGDAFYECRDRYAILLTDGVPDPMFRDARFGCYPDPSQPVPPGKECAPVSATVKDDGTVVPGGSGSALCECPYPTETDLAERLRTENGLTQLFVIAFNVEGSEALSILNQIAQRGGEHDAYLADSQEDLKKVIDEIVSRVQSDATSRSVPQMVDSGRAMHLGGKQYEITAGFAMGETETDLRQGYLYRQRFGCNETGNTPVALPLDAEEGDMFHLELNKQAAANDRKLVTVKLTSETAPKKDATLRSHYYEVPEPYTTSRYNLVLPNKTKLTATAPTYGTATEVSWTLVDFANEEAKLPAAVFGGNPAVRTRVVDYVRGFEPKEKRRDRVLADIYHSNPVVLPPLAAGSRYLDTEEESLNAELLDLVSEGGKHNYYGDDGRPGVVFVGTNDGVLHAFNLDTWHNVNGEQRGSGYEFWGFVPPALFGKLPTASVPTHTELFDGTPQVRTMMLGRDATSGPLYRTVLVSALRSVASFVALDVSLPHEPPIFLWQFTAPKMGRTVGTPALTQALIKWGSASQETGETGVRERAIAILPGGAGEQVAATPTACALQDNITEPSFPANDTRSHVRCWKQTGRALYVVDVATGELLQEFDYRHFPSPLTGAVAVDGQGLDVSKAAYFTDEDGVLWRLSMVDPDPSHWEVEPLFDLFYSDKSSDAFKNGRPSVYAPLLSRDMNGNNVIIVGTGDVDSLVDPTRHRLVSLLERRELEESSVGMSFGGTVEINWEHTFDAGESVTGPLSLFDRVVYFGSFVSPQGGNVCDLGNSRIWGVHYLDPENPDGNPREPRPMLPEDPAAETINYVHYLQDESLENSLVLGVAVSAMPLCFQVQQVTDPFVPGGQGYQSVGPVQGGNYQLRAMVGGGGGEKQTHSALHQFSMGLSVSSHASMVGWGGLVE